MSKEILDVQSQCDEVVAEYSGEKLQKWFEAIKALDGEEKLDLNQVATLLKNANSWVRWIGGRRSIYRKYEFHLFKDFDDQLIITQGEEIEL